MSFSNLRLKHALGPTQAPRWAARLSRSHQLRSCVDAVLILAGIAVCGGSTRTSARHVGLVRALDVAAEFLLEIVISIRT